MSGSKRIKAVLYSAWEIVVCVPIILAAWIVMALAWPIIFAIDRVQAWRDRRKR